MRYTVRTERAVGTDLIAHILAQRGATTAAARSRFLAPDYARDTHDPYAFHAMEGAVERLVAAHARGEKIGIYGDYDADGVCGATLLKDVFDALGFDSEVYIPHKERDGHGLSMRAVEHFARAGIALIVTVDCGITNIAEVAAARERGMESVIIDHHHVPATLPDAVAVINPKLPDSGYPFDALCGTGTAFKVAQALYARMAPAQQEQTKWLLDLVAIATVADCMPLVGENRTLVAYGLIVLQKTRRAGLRALFDRARIAQDRAMDTQTIGFRIAPRLNAAGRMGHAQDAHALLVARDAAEAQKRAAALEALNDERRKTSDAMTADARATVRALPTLPAGIVIGSETFFHGVVGLVAGRLAEEFARPVGVFHHMGETSLGSFRSRGGVHIVDVLHAVHERVPQALIKYGGHAAAAGATLRREHFDAFAAAFDEAVRTVTGSAATDVATVVDAVLAPQEVTADVATALTRMAPFGIGNEEPLFAFADVPIVAMRMVGSDGAHVKFAFGDASHRLDGIGFSLAKKVANMAVGDRVTILARVRENVWNGRTSVQLVVEDIAKGAIPPVEN